MDRAIYDQDILQLRSLLDWFERGLVTLLFAWMAFSVADDVLYGEYPEFVAFLAVEFVVVVLVLLRRPADQISAEPWAWLIACCGTCLPLLAIPSATTPLLPLSICIALILIGVVCQLSGKIILKRSFGVVAANRGVKTGGPYAVVRHPIYLGYTLTHAGLLLLGPSAWNLILYGVTFILQVGRILVEEEFLRRDAAYRLYAGTVRYRLLPGLF